MRLAICASLMLLAQVALAADPIPELGPAGTVKKVQGNFQFLEGPASDNQGNLYFSDIPANRIYQLNIAGTIAPLLDPSNHTNGLMIISTGKLAACEMDGRIVSIDLATKKVTPLAENYQGKRFNAPNDLVIDQAGGVYFTDPRFRAPMPLPQEKEGFYYLAADGKVTRLGDNLPAPNGIILSPDEKTLYVIPSMQKEMLAYNVEAPGKIGPQRTFCTLAQRDPAGNGGGDGLTVDSKGNLYITSGMGLQVFDPAGKALGIIEIPEQPANCSFGGQDLKTLFVTARTSLYSVPMTVKGHLFPGKEAK